MTLSTPRIPPGSKAVDRPIPPDFNSTKCWIYTVDLIVEKDDIRFLYLARTTIDGPIEAAVAEALKPVPVPVVKPPTPLDVGLKEAGYVLFRLNPAKNWHFSESWDGVALKDKSFTGRFGGYSEVRVAEPRLPGSPQRTKVVYFTVQPPPPSGKPYPEYEASFNLHVEIWNLFTDPETGRVEQKLLPLTIDPDIKYPGGTEP